MADGSDFLLVRDLDRLGGMCRESRVVAESSRRENELVKRR